MTATVPLVTPNSCCKTWVEIAWPGIQEKEKLYNYININYQLSVILSPFIDFRQCQACHGTIFFDTELRDNKKYYIFT